MHFNFVNSTENSTLKNLLVKLVSSKKLLNSTQKDCERIFTTEHQQQ